MCRRHYETAVSEAAAEAGETSMMSQKRCELSTAELKEFNGTGPSGKLYVAVNGKIFDVTDKGAQFYGKGMCVHCCVSRKTSHLTCDHDFGKFRLIFKVLQLTEYLY